MEIAHKCGATKKRSMDMDVNGGGEEFHEGRNSKPLLNICKNGSSAFLLSIFQYYKHQIILIGFRAKFRNSTQTTITISTK